MNIQLETIHNGMYYSPSLITVKVSFRAPYSIRKYVFFNMIPLKHYYSFYKVIDRIQNVFNSSH